MGYHDLEPEAFVLSVAVQQTNSAEEATLFENWLDKSMKKARAMLKNTTLGVGSDIAISASSESISKNSE